MSQVYRLRHEFLNIRAVHGSFRYPRPVTQLHNKNCKLLVTMDLLKPNI